MPTLGLNTYMINMVSAMETPGKTSDQHDCMSDFEGEMRGDCMVGVRG